jgi:C4-type Zn-finger protein
MNPERLNKQSDSEGKPEPDLLMRRKSKYIPNLSNRCHRIYSGQQSAPTSDISIESGAASHAMKKTLEGIMGNLLSPSKARVSICFNRELGSNEIEESDLQE